MQKFIFLGKSSYTKVQHRHFTVKTVIDKHIVNNLETIFFCIAAHHVPYRVKTYDWKQNIIYITLLHIENEKINHLIKKDIFIRDIQIKKHNITDKNHLMHHHVWHHEKYIGIITKVEAYPSQTMLHIQQEKNIILVPWHPALIKETDYLQKKIVLQLPEDYLTIFSKP